MAENPGQWGPATHVIDRALDGIARQMAEDARTGDFTCGFTHAFQIADALQRAGFLEHTDIWVDDTPTPQREEPT